MMRVLLVLMVVACSSTPRATSAVATPSPAPGAPAAQAGSPEADAVDPPEPGLRLPRNFLPVTYRARLAIDPAKDGFTGSIEIEGDVRERSRRLWLHGRGLAVTAAKIVRGDRALAVEVTTAGDDLLSLRPAEPLEPGRHTVVLEYRGAFDAEQPVGAYRKVYEDHAYIATQFESIYARRVFPSFDEPDSKVPWQLTLDVPAALVAVSNTPITAETALDATTRRVAFAQTRPLPSYLLAFAVGPYEIVDAGKTRSGTPMRIIALKGHAGGARWAAETTPRILQRLEDYFGTPYPYEKLDQIAQPHLVGGAMEHPGLITYAKGLILTDPARITHAQRLAWVDVAAHELAHQWFGNLVTMAWWDDIWLNEGFASWLGSKVTHEVESSWRRDVLAAAERDFALDADGGVTARRVRQPIAAVGDIFQAFDSITYQKGQSVLAMFEQRIGPERFRDGVRAYMAKHRFGSATSSDFLAAISRAAGRDLAPAFATFLDQAGAPVVRAELRCEPGQPPRLQLAQHRYLQPGTPAPAQAQTWQLPVCVAFDRGGERGEVCTELTTPTAELALDAPGCPAWLFPNAGGHGYYRSSQPDAALVALRDRGWNLLTPVERKVAFDDLSAFTETGAVDVATKMSFVPQLMAEKHRFAVSAAVAAAGQARRVLAPARIPELDAWIRATFGPAARALSWRPRPGDDIDAEQQRNALVSLVSWSGDPALRAAAVKLASNWAALAPASRSRVLGVAADADRRTFERMVAAAPVEKDPELRADLLRGLVQVGDPARLRTVLALTWDRRLDLSEVGRLLFAGRTYALRGVAEAYFRDHMAELLQRFPENGDDGAANLAFAFLGGCDAARRDEVAGFVRATFGRFIGAERAIAQGLEGLDACIAIRGLLGPRFEAWLARPRR
jgi:cytosol alanyl aminopeptidase